MDDSYITCELLGRLGNQLFEIANAYARGLDCNKNFFLPKGNHAGSYGIDANLKNIYRKLNTIERLPKNGIYNPPDPATVNAPIIYVGYFQSEMYFKKYSNIIRSLFGCSEEHAEKTLKTFPQLSSSIVTSIHVRRGDYMNLKGYHPVISLDYIKHCMSLVPDTEYFFVSSDDMDWCKENLKQKNIIFVEKHEPYEQIWTMELCHNFIMSNSSFSWWGAYLSHNKNKKVFAPSTWFGPDGLQNWNDIYCEGMEKIKTKYIDGYIYPDI